MKHQLQVRSKEFAIKLTLTPGAFYHNCIFQTFWQIIFNLEMGQISSDLLKKAFAT